MASNSSERPVDVLGEAVRLGDVRGAALATVIRVAGSAPRRPPAKMVVLVDGTSRGTIGGGRIEREVCAAARAVARREAPPLRFVRNLARDLAMCCGGEMELWIEPLDASRVTALAEALRRRARRVSVALVTALDGMGGGGKDLVVDDPCLRGGKARLDGDRFVEPVVPPERLVLFGGGHVAEAIAPLALRVGFDVIVCDEEEAFASEMRFPGVRLLLSFDAQEVMRELAPFGPGDYAVVVTRDHAVDQAIVERLLPVASLTYLGLIGSQGKLDRFRRRLTAKGLDEPAAWSRLHAPIGLDIGAETPEEIAVSVVAELVKVRRLGA